MSMTPHQDAVRELARQMAESPAAHPQIAEIRKLMLEVQMSLARMSDDGASAEEALNFGMSLVHSLVSTLAGSYRHGDLDHQQMQMRLVSGLVRVMLLSRVEEASGVIADEQFVVPLRAGRA